MKIINKVLTKKDKQKIRFPKNRPKTNSRTNLSIFRFKNPPLNQ